MEEDRLLALVESHIEGRLTADEQAELEAELIRSPEARAVYWDCLNQHALLREIALKAKGRAFAVRRRRLPRWVFGSAAAALLLGVSLYFLWPGEPPAGVARLEEVKGRVEVVSPEGRVAASTGMEILPGQGVETLSADSGATLVYPDGTRVKATPRTVLRALSGNGSGKRVTLAKGSIAAVVKPQPSGRPMRFATPHGEATVLGTSLRIVVDVNGKALTRLEVEDGKVRLKSALDTKTVDVQSGQYAVAAAGVELVAKPLSARTLEAIRGMAPRSWYSIPDTKMRAVVPTSGQFPGTWGIMGPSSVIHAWSGGALDTKRGRLLLWGGRGAGDYRGNEIYAFDLSSLEWQRLTDPFVNPVEDLEVNADGTPSCQSSYNCLAYLEHADRLFTRTATMTWTFDPGSMKWARRTPSPDGPPLGYSSNCSYDLATRKVWWGGTPGFWSYDPERDAWAKHGDEGFNDHTSVIDPKRGLLVVVGNGEVFTYDLRNGDFNRKNRPTTGGDAFIGKQAAGLDYDPVRDRIVGWHGGAVHLLNLETNSWTVQEATGAPATTPNGIYGRWRYVPSLDAFVVVTDIDENVHVYKPGR